MRYFLYNLLIIRLGRGIYVAHFYEKRLTLRFAKAQFIAAGGHHLSLLPVIIDDSCLPSYKALGQLKKENLKG